MRGRKLTVITLGHDTPGSTIKKESPNEGTETIWDISVIFFASKQIKKESPNEGTETIDLSYTMNIDRETIKKESPNEGTETCISYFVASARRLGL